MSSKETLEQFGSCWEGLEDPRSGNAALHDFHELLMIALCCVLCGGQGAVDMAVFAESKEPFLRSFLTLANSLPKGDYALALKGNQGTLFDDVVLLLDDPELKASTAAPVVEADHPPRRTSRRARRRCQPRSTGCRNSTNGRA